MSSQDRFPPLNPSDMTLEQLEAHEYMLEKADKFFGDSFKYKTSSNPPSLLGPFAPLLRTPSLCKPYTDLNLSLASVSAPYLSPTARETAILAVGAIFGANYELYAHERIALDKSKLSREQIQALVKGEVSEGLGKEGEVVLGVVGDLLGRSGDGEEDGSGGMGGVGRIGGKLGKERWEEAVGVFGKEGAVCLVQYVASYAYTCILLNGCDVGLPEGEEIW